MIDPLSVAVGTLALVTAALAVAQNTCKLIDDIEPLASKLIFLASRLLSDSLIGVSIPSAGAVGVKCLGRASHMISFTVP